MQQTVAKESLAIDWHQVAESLPTGYRAHLEELEVARLGLSHPDIDSNAGWAISELVVQAQVERKKSVVVAQELLPALGTALEAASDAFSKPASELSATGVLDVARTVISELRGEQRSDSRLAAYVEGTARPARDSLIQAAYKTQAQAVGALGLGSTVE